MTWALPCKDANACTGCGACVAICPLGCITMSKDRYGASIPEIDSAKCSGCGLCEKRCPVNTPPKLAYPKSCYATWLDNREERALCASGGLAHSLSKYAIESLNGAVFGVVYNGNMEPVYQVADSVGDLEPFKGSKYVQSRIEKSIYLSIRQLLNEGRFVLFVGTPCQIAGLYSVVGKDSQNLLTVDLICHGVAPDVYLAEELRNLNRNGKESICNVRFRGNDDFRYTCGLMKRLLGRGRDGNNFCMTLWSRNKDGSQRRIYRGDKNHNYYLRGFLDGITLRENCYSCKYARPERVADITLGDFIGLGSKEAFPYPTGNVSSVFTNTEKGRRFFLDAVGANPYLRNFERSYDERLRYRPSLLEPYPRHPLNSEFRRLYPELGYAKAIRRVLWRRMMKDRICLNLDQFLAIPFRFGKRFVKLLLHR